jgi:endo-1,4-beta-D-glucanase Y
MTRQAYLRLRLTSPSNLVLLAVTGLLSCAAPATNGGGSGGGNGSGGNGNGSGGNGNGSGGSNNGSGGSNNGSGGGNSSGGNNGSGGGVSSGGSNGSGGSSAKGGSNGSGGSSSSGGSNGSGGSSSSGGSTGSGGSTSKGGSTGSGGGTSSGGSTGSGGSSTRSCPLAGANVISDLEDGMGDEEVQGGRQGWWYVFADSNGGSQTPAANSSGPIAVASVSAPLPTGDTCDMYAMHSTATGHAASNTSNYEGFGVSLDQIMPPPTGTTAKTKMPYDVSSYTGISFNIKSGSGTAPPVWFELGTLNNQPQPDGTIKTSDGTSGGTVSAPSSNGTDEYNTRGVLIKNLGTTWTQVYVPFGILGPRYLPAGNASVCSNSAVKCEAPPFKPTDVLGLQFSVYPQFSTSTLNYDLWVDDVSFYTGSNGLASFTAGALAVDGSVGSCTKPAGAAMKYLTNMYANWKSTFVTGSGSSTRVQRPENADDTVSEGIAYGMLLAVNFNDQALFDNLWSYEQAHKISASGSNLMTWCIDGGSGGMGSQCSATGGSATDADEDMAFALLLAGKQWGGSYTSTGTSLIGDIWSHDIDTSSNLPTGGSNYGSTSSKVTNPSYFAPAYYRIFATVDSGHAWGSVVTAVYSAISSIAGKATKAGLLPAWCSSNCTAVGSNGGSDDSYYQYDAHRVPWRLGIDACWNGVTTGNSFLMNNASFFTSQSSAGVGRVQDIYLLSGTPNSDSAPNSMSAIGTAGVGAMAVGNSFASTAYQFLLDASYSPASTIPDSNGRVSYSYFNATVGLLTALTMSGNFNHP